MQTLLHLFQIFSSSVDTTGVLLQVPEQIFITDKLPKGATGKIQRRHMPAAFLGDKNKSKQSSGDPKQPAKDSGKPLHHSKL